MKKISKIMASALALSQVCTTAFAIGVDSTLTSYDFDSGVFHIEGSSAYVNQPVKLEILKRDISFDALDDIGDYLYMAQVYSGSDKLFSFDVPVEDIGAFSYRVSALGDSTVYSSGFATYTDETVNRAIYEYINNENRTTADLSKLIEDYYPGIGVDINLYKQLDPDVSGKMLVNINGTTYDDEETFKTDVAYRVAVSVICSEIDSAARVKYIEDMADKLGISDKDYFESYSDFDDEDKAEIAQDIKADSPYDTFGENLKNSLVIFEVGRAVWNGVADILDKYLDCGASDLFEKVSDKSEKAAVTKLKEAIEDGDITNAEDMYDYLKDNIPSGGSSSGGSSSGSSGGRGSSGGGSYRAPATVEAPVTEAVSNVPAAETKYFADTDSVPWAEPAIAYLYKKGVINGKAENIFAPNDSVTREEFVKMIILAFDIELSDAACSFEDVSADAWYYRYVATANSFGIVKGNSPTQFGTGSNIKRQDMAQILYNVLTYVGANTDVSETVEYTDKDDISDYAQKAIEVLSAMDCLNGDDEGNVLPQKNSTRAEAAKLIYSVSTSIGK